MSDVYKVLRKLDEGGELYSFCAVRASNRAYKPLQHLVYRPGKATKPLSDIRPLFALINQVAAEHFMKSYISLSWFERGDSGYELWLADGKDVQPVYSLPDWVENADYWPGTVFCSSITLKKRLR